LSWKKLGRPVFSPLLRAILALSGLEKGEFTI